MNKNLGTATWLQKFLARWSVAIIILSLSGVSLAFTLSESAINRERLFTPGNGSRVDRLLKQLTTEEKLSMLGGTGFGTRPIERLGIPSIEMIDGQQGVRGPRATAFPSNLALVATWNHKLWRKQGAAVGREARAIGKNMILAPCPSPLRVPQGGRNYECASEDPYLNSEYASAYVFGTHDAGIMSSTKPFVLNDQEVNRFHIDMLIDEQSLHEFELPGFEAALRAGSESIMVSYNKVNGVHATESPYILQQLIRKEMGFTGIILSDWGATHDGLAAARAGLDLEMPYADHMTPALREALRTQTVSIESIDQKVRTLLVALEKIGELDHKPVPKSSDLNSAENQDVALNVAREAIVLLKNESALLPLDTQLVKSIAVIGPNAGYERGLAAGSGYVTAFKNTTVLEGIRKEFGARTEVRYEPGVQVPEQFEFFGSDFKAEYFANRDLSGKPKVVRQEDNIQVWNTMPPVPGLTHGAYSARWSGKFQLDQPMKVKLDLGCTGRDYKLFIDEQLAKDTLGREDLWDVQFETAPLAAGEHSIKFEYRNNADYFCLRLGWKPPEPDFAKSIELARHSDIAVVVVGTSDQLEGEEKERPSLKLPGRQEELIEAVARVNPRTVVVNISGGPVIMRDWLDKVPAVLHAGFLGQTGGQAIAEVLSGAVNPSGRLPMTYPCTEEDSPSAAYYKNAWDQIDYSKVGIFEGYRGYEKNHVVPEFPFGSGLSYSKFSTENLAVRAIQASVEDPKLIAELDVTNISSRLGAEVVQVFVRDTNPQAGRPPRELKAFEKVLLAPGERRKLRFQLNTNAFRHWDSSVHRWVISPDDYEIQVGQMSQTVHIR